MATRGMPPVSWRKSRADSVAMVASWSTLGFGMTPQSAKVKTPFSPYSVIGHLQHDARGDRLDAGSGLMSWKSGRRMLPEFEVAPPTRPSTWPFCSMSAPK
jgi:hypothetical protein